MEQGGGGTGATYGGFGGIGRERSIDCRRRSCASSWKSMFNIPRHARAMEAVGI